MTNRTHTGILILVLAAGLSACNGASSLTAPSTSQPPLTPPPVSGNTNTLSGVVFEVTPAGNAPVEGVKILCDTCGALGHSERVTDVNGAYSFGEVANGRTPLWLSKPGYNLSQPDYTGQGGGGMNAAVNGDTRFDIELIRH